MSVDLLYLLFKLKLIIQTMKRFIFSIGLALATVLSVQAQDRDMKDNQDMIQGDGIQIMAFSEFPKDVQDRFKISDHSDAAIEEAYVLKGVALENVLNNESMEIYIGDLPPEKLYVLQLTTNDVISKVLYYLEDGELYATNEINS